MTRPHPKFAVWLLACLLWAMAVPVPAQDSPKPFTQQQLDELLAPIALYPDALLAQVLMASTYPLEVVEAARWSKANPKVTGKALDGLFLMIGEEERKIRQDPVGTGSAILRKVFGVLK